MSEYIEFTLFDEKGVERNVKMNKDDENEVYLWKDKWRGQPMKKPYWKKCAISKMTNGYHRIVITNKLYYLHRVCYYAHNPEWDIYNNSQQNVIDHIDRNPSNNHISNLRQATNTQNSENNNAKGYFYDNTYKRWVARIGKHGKQYRKCCRTEDEAIKERENLKAKYHTFGI